MEKRLLEGFKELAGKDERSEEFFIKARKDIATKAITEHTMLMIQMGINQSNFEKILSHIQNSMTNAYNIGKSHGQWQNSPYRKRF